MFVFQTSTVSPDFVNVYDGVIIWENFTSVPKLLLVSFSLDNNYLTDLIDTIEQYMENK